MERYVSVRIVLVKAIRCTCIGIIESINYIQIHAHQQAIYSCYGFNWYELSFSIYCTIYIENRQYIPAY